MLDSFILKTDSYKLLSHWMQYPPGTEYIASYFEPRKGAKYPFTLFFGLQYILKKHFLGVQVTREKIDRAENIALKHGGHFNREGWEHILNVHGGKLPLLIRAVPEGTLINGDNVLLTVVNTDPNCFWLTNYAETILTHVWYPTMVATQSYYMKQIIKKYLEKNGDDLPDFKLHDFGYRGVSCCEQAAIGGAAHLLNFQGTDTIAGMEMLHEYYGADVVSGFSIPASEHSTITSWGKEHELDAMANMLEKYPQGLVACVSDSFNIYKACRQYWGKDLRDKILARDGVLVVRPDCYDEETEILTDGGWMLFKDIGVETTVAQYKNGNIEFGKPTKYINQDYSGDMIHITNDKRGVDLLVTPNHRCYTKNKDGKIRVKEAKDISYYYDNNHIMGGRLHTKNSIVFSAKDMISIVFQADGSYESGFDVDSSFKNGLTKIRFNFAKQRKTDRLISICEKGGYQYSIHQEQGRPNQKTIYVIVPFKIYKTFEWVQNIIKNIDFIYCREFIEECSYWDATRRTEMRFKYDSTIAINAEIIQLLACLSGYKTKYSISPDDRKDCFNDVHTVHIIKQDFIDGQGIKKETVKYIGKIYCVAVDSGAIVVRRNNRISISGNSGDPRKVLPEILNLLACAIGYSTNSKGFKVLDPHVRVIQGDGVDADSLEALLNILHVAGWSADNIAFGSGGGLLQKVNRDIQKFAFKCSAVYKDGMWNDVYKSPVDDKGKQSKRGLLKLVQNPLEKLPVEYRTENLEDTTSVFSRLEKDQDDVLQEVFRDGELLRDYSYAEVMARIN